MITDRVRPMTPSVLRANLISGYINTFESISNDKHGNPVRAIVSEKDLVSFKNWVLSTLLGNKVLDEMGYQIDAVDVILADTFKRQAIPPYKLLYPSLLRIFRVFTFDELTEHFGESFAIKVRDFK